MFGDDTSLFSSNNNIHDLFLTTNKELKKIVKWFNANKLLLNLQPFTKYLRQYLSFYVKQHTTGKVHFLFFRTYRKSGTQDPKVGRGTQDPQVGPYDGTLRWDPEVGP